jgi:hypothetical protein
MSPSPIRHPRTALPLELHGALRKLGGALLRGPARGAAPIPPRGDGNLIVASYNIHKCVGVDNRFDPGFLGRFGFHVHIDLTGGMIANQDNRQPRRVTVSSLKSRRFLRCLKIYTIGKSTAIDNLCGHSGMPLEIVAHMQPE